MPGYKKKRGGGGKGRGRGRGGSCSSSSDSSVDAPMTDAECIAAGFNRYNPDTGQCEYTAAV